MQRILLILEESATLRHALKKAFSSKGYDITVAENYATGLDYLKSCASGSCGFSGFLIGWPAYTDNRADEILVSLSSPGLRKLPVLLLSDEGDPAKMDWVTKRGGVGLLAWGDYEEATNLMAKLDESLKREPGPKIFPRVGQVVKILVVDDSPSVRFSIRNLLLNSGYQVETAASAQEGIELAFKQSFDIAIIDYFMPDHNGDVMVRLLKQNSATKNIVSAIITGTYSDDVIRDCLAAGAVECMFKNEAQELFLARVGALTKSVLDRRSIENERKRLESILSSVGDGVYGVDKSGDIEFINPAAKKMLGYPEVASLIGRSAHVLFHYATPEGDLTNGETCFLSNCYDKASQLTSWQTVFWHRKGHSFPVECSVYPLEMDGEHVGSVVAFRDISERKVLEEELRWQASHDPLTKLFNRKYFEEQIDEEVEKLKRNNSCSALLLVDIDRFKYINDTAGHVAGDALLVDVGKRLQRRLRSSDTLARIGGDEYAIIIRNIVSGHEEVMAAAEAFRHVLEEKKFFCGGRSYDVTATFGVSILDRNTKSLEEVMTNADIACHIAKTKGRNQTHIFSGDHDRKASMHRELGWSSRLREALKKNLFVLNFQPIVPIKSIDFSGLPDQTGQVWLEYLIAKQMEPLFFEVLLRLQDTSGDYIVPDAFLPTAERFDIMPDIDRWVIDNAFNYLAKNKVKAPAYHLAINLSAQILTEDDTAKYIKDRLKTYAIDPRFITFEITETQAVTNIDATKALIAELRGMGCKFALDDFGSGFSSFSHLKHLDVDYIKIDGMFTKGINDNPIDKAVVLAVTEMARSLNKKTVVEYIENPEVLKTLQLSNIDYAQGYYISKPIRALNFG